MVLLRETELREQSLSECQAYSKLNMKLGRFNKNGSVGGIAA